jgi:hypothetical protein
VPPAVVADGTGLVVTGVDVLTNVSHGLTGLMAVLLGYAMYRGFAGAFGRTELERRRFRWAGIGFGAFGVLVCGLAVWDAAHR